MLFNSFQFLIFFPIVVLIYFIIPKRIKYIWLLVASYYFYMGWNPKYALLLVMSTLLTWITGLGVERFRQVKQGAGAVCAKACIALCCVINLGILVFFKYFDFILDNINLVIGRIGLQVLEKPFDIVLPVGISFYIFQALGYIIDVYRGEIAAERNIGKYALFVSFFPQLVAGPIERSGNLLDQINDIPNKKLVDYERITNGLLYMLYGFFLKLVIADRISLMVDTVFDSWYTFGTVELAVAAIGFGIQIYCDFSGYSTIAIGCASVMGFELMENFEAPYFAGSIKEFWKRWHISLSSWFRDYVYIPLGGNRCSVKRKWFNLMVTFLTSGLWHGANWTFILWGGVHGIFQILGELLQPIKKKIYPMIGIRLDSISYKIGQIVTTFVLVDFAWIFFRAADIRTAFGYIRNLFVRWDPWVIADRTLYKIGLSNYEWNILLIAVLLMAAVDLVRILKRERIDVFLNSQGALVKGIVIAFMLLMIGIFGKYGGDFDANAFIYFQF